MKIYRCPTEVPPPVVNYSNYNRDKEAAAEQKHMADLKNWLIAKGWTGKYTGEIISFGVADGRACYMMADGKNSCNSCLIHLPYGDAYQYPDAAFLPKSEIIRRIESEKKLNELFSKKG